MHRLLILAIATLASLPLTARAAGGFDEAMFAAWAETRTGSGAPVYWYSVGTIDRYPSGETIAIMEGFDTARRVDDPATGDVWQLSRKIYIFRDPKTGELLTGADGKPIPPVAYPYQYIVYKRQADGTVATTVEQGAGARLATIGPVGGMAAMQLGDAVTFNAPVWLDFPAGPGRYQAWENYDFFVQPAAAGINPRYQLSWARYGAMPAWTGETNGIMRMTGWRIDRFEDLPEAIRAYVEAEAPLWRAPPADLADIRRLQAE